MKRLPFVLFAAVLLPSLKLSAASPVVISEFMADNTRVLFDEDGVSSDWIEIHNVTTTNVNLAGWFLTDNSGNLRKWEFPATNLNAGAYMVIFASDHDRRVPGRPLHTGFKLDPDGEFLALVEPGGTNIATQFTNPYPDQVPNVSFGFGLITSNTTLVAAGAAVRALVPTTGNGGHLLGHTWKGTNEPFADGSWLSGVTGVGFSSAGAPGLVADTSLAVRLNFDAAPVANVIVDSKPIGVTINGANAGAAWQPASADISSPPITRAGVMQFVGAEADQITLPASASFGSAQGTILFWMRSLGPAGAGNGQGVILDRRVGSANPFVAANGAVILQELDGRITFQSFSNGPVASSFSSTASAGDDRWHHVAVVYDQLPTGSVAVYIDGVLDGSMANSRGWNWPASQQLELGRSHEPQFRKYDGSLDDFRIYNRALTATEIARIHSGDGGVPAADIGLNVQADMLDVNASAFVRIPFTVADPNAFSLLTLRGRFNDGFAAWINGQLVGAVNAPDPLVWSSSATASNASVFPVNFVLSALARDEETGLTTNLLRSGVNILAIQGLNVTLDDPTFLVLPELVGTSVPQESTNAVYFTQPTPGEANTSGAGIPGPILTDVEHFPNVPLDSENLRVTAKVTRSFNTVSNITLRYRIMYNTEVGVPMTDDGTGGDLVAGDGILSALIPAGASTSGHMIRYYVTARDTQGNQSRWPLFHSPTNSAEYLGTVVNPGYVTSKLPIYYIYMQNPANAEGNAGTRGSFFHDGEFYDNIFVSFRGNSSASFSKKAHRLEFNRDQRFRHSPDLPRIGDTSLLGEFADPTYFRQMLSFWMLNAFGTPAPFSYPVRVETNGGFWQLALHSDVHGEEQLERMGYDPQGALYKAVGQLRPTFESTGVFEKKTRRFEDRSDYLALANGINESQSLATRATNIFDMLDVPNVINYLTVARWVQEADDVWANMSIYRDTRGDQLWRVIPFDMNVSWGQLYCGDSPSVYNVILATNDNLKSHPFYGGQTVLVNGGGNWNRLYDAIVRVPETRQMLLRRMRTLLDTMLQPPETHPLALQLEKRIGAFTNLIWAEAFLDRQKHGWPSTGPYCYGINQWLTNHVADTVNQFIVPRRKHWYVTHSITNTTRPLGISNANNAGIPLGQPTNALIDVARVEFNPSSGNQGEEFICLTNSNPYAVDISDWKLDNAVNFTFKGGTVMPSNSVLYVSPNTLAFRNRPVAPRGGMGLFAVGPYQGQLSARGEPITLHDNRGRLVYTNSYPGNPSSAQQFLRITEIMYSPSPLTGNTNDAQEFEYIELKNISASTTLNLAGVRFINGILFDFTGSAVTSLTPGQRVVVAKNPAAFTARYGGGVSIAGQYSGFLDNGGERLQLVDAVSEEIHDFDYESDWYPITDGAGFSLAVVSEFAVPESWDSKTNWRPSGVVNGAPGQPDPAPPTFPGIVINEVLTHTDPPPPTDTIELFNPTAGNVNIGGWFLSDDFGTPLKFRIPDNTTIPAGGYLTFNEGVFNTPTNAPTSFALSSKGDEVYLFSGDGTKITGYAQGYSFGAAANGVSFGRYTNSQTNVHFVAQGALTLGGGNAGPKVGPVVISEIMYHPVDLPGGEDNSDDEFIELQNISGSPVALFDPANPVNTWRVRGGVDINLPMNITLQANALLLLVNFNPADPDNAAKLSAFRTKFNVPGGMLIIGPYDGKLDNASDDLKLERPDVPDGAEVPYILVDRVEYEDHVPWPDLADGTGVSLRRIDVTQYGNDPVNWAGSAPTAGAASPGGGSAPAVVIQPEDQNGIASQIAAFSVVASGTGPLRYQWRFNGDGIAGATNSTLLLTDLQVEQAGQYSVTVFNNAGTTVSSNATLSIQFPPFLTALPQSVRLRGSTNNADYGFTTNNAVFSAAAIGTGPVQYQWRFNGVPIAGANGNSYTVVGADFDKDEGVYDCVVTDTVGSIVTPQSRLMVLLSPTIIGPPPTNYLVASNGSISASVVIRGNPAPFYYRWNEGSSFRVGATNDLRTNYMVYGPITNSVARTWRIIVTNEANVAPTAFFAFSVAAVLDTDRDGIPDQWETDYGFGTNNLADAAFDSDDDGMSNYAEYFAGTNPTNSASYLRVDGPILGSGATVSFGAVSNRTYSVLYSDLLDASAWMKLGDIQARNTNHVESLTDAGGGTNRFYRVVTPAQ